MIYALIIGAVVVLIIIRTIIRRRRTNADELNRGHTNILYWASRGDAQIERCQDPVYAEFIAELVERGLLAYKDDNEGRDDGVDTTREGNELVWSWQPEDY